MKVDTTRFGVLELDESSVIRIPRGLIGFEDRTEFVLIQHRADTNFRWLQSTEEPSLAFVVVDPSQFYNDYEIEITDADAERLNLTSEEDALVLVVVAIGQEGKEITANLAAPVVINSKELVGAQVVPQDNRYTVKHLLVEQVEQSSEDTTTIKAA